MTEIARTSSAPRRNEEEIASKETRSCQTSPEQRAEAEEARRQESDRAAEARRDAYLASGTHEGGRSYRASSDASRVETSNPDDVQAKVAARTRRMDPPLQDDVLGNALVGVAAGGLGGAVRSAAGQVGMRGVGGALVKPYSAGTAVRIGRSAEVAGVLKAEGAAGEAFVKGATNSVKTGVASKAVTSGTAAVAKEGVHQLVDRNALHAPTASTPDAAPATAAGRSSPKAASEAAPEPTQSTSPRIPEALPQQVSIRG